MKHLRLLSRVTGTPLFIQESKLRVITDSVVLPMYLGKEEEIENIPSMSMATQKPGVAVPAKIGVINVFDSLVAKGGA